MLKTASVVRLGAAYGGAGATFTLGQVNAFVSVVVGVLTALYTALLLYQKASQVLQERRVRREAEALRGKSPRTKADE